MPLVMSKKFFLKEKAKKKHIIVLKIFHEHDTNL